MKQQLIQTQAQKLALTQSLLQSLHFLQLPIPELINEIRDASLSNPMLEMEDAPLGELHIDSSAISSDHIQMHIQQQLQWQSHDLDTDPSQRDSLSGISYRETFTDYLYSQVGQSSLHNDYMRYLCRFLIANLNEDGYLDCPLDELASELGVPYFDMEQALYAVQALDPPGVGARSLSECLLLQLMESSDFNELNIHMIRYGLPLLAEGDYTGLSKLFKRKLAEIHHAAAVIRRLNPKPSRGFSSGHTVGYVIPEAIISSEGNELLVEMNVRIMPKLQLNSYYYDMMNALEYSDAHDYLNTCASQAKELIYNVEKRQNTLYRVICYLVDYQSAFFLSKGSLRPLTMKQLSQALDLSNSTISRAIKDKCVQHGTQIIMLRDLFSASLPSLGGMAVSALAIKEKLQRFVELENKSNPLSDEALCEALAGCGMLLSRRTVAKYRAELGIPSTVARRQKK